MWKRRGTPEAQHRPILAPSSSNSGSGFFFCLFVLPWALFPAILGLPLEQFFKDSPTAIKLICHCYTSLLKLNSVLSKRLSPGTSLEVQWRGHRFDLWSGNIPQTTEQVSLCTLSTEARTAWSRCSTTGEAATVRSPSTTVRSSLCSTKAPSTERGVRQWQPRAAKESN